MQTLLKKRNEMHTNIMRLVKLGIFGRFDKQVLKKMRNFLNRNALTILELCAVSYLCDTAIKQDNDVTKYMKVTHLLFTAPF